MVINIHAGHNPDGEVACGAVGIIKESTEARAVKEQLIKILKQYGNIVYDCTCDNGTSKGDVLKKIVEKCNAHEVDLDISIHFNSGAGEYRKEENHNGVEVSVYDYERKIKEDADRIGKNIANMGFINRGIKVRPDLYILRTTKNPAILIECCFVDDSDDVNLYNPNTMAKAIAEAITQKTAAPMDLTYKVQLKGIYHIVDAEILVSKLEQSGFEAQLL